MADFSPQQKRALRKLTRRLPHSGGVLKDVESFLLSYIAFEAVARKVWHYYRCRKTTKSKKSESTAGIPINELIKAMDYYEMQLHSTLLHELLDSKRVKKGDKSARCLRNGIVHRWAENDCKEVQDKHRAFSKAFVDFQQAVAGKL